MIRAWQRTLSVLVMICSSRLVPKLFSLVPVGGGKQNDTCAAASWVVGIWHKRGGAHLFRTIYPSHGGVVFAVVAFTFIPLDPQGRAICPSNCFHGPTLVWNFPLGTCLLVSCSNGAGLRKKAIEIVFHVVHAPRDYVIRVAIFKVL